MLYKGNHNYFVLCFQIGANTLYEHEWILLFLRCQTFRHFSQSFNWTLSENEPQISDKINSNSETPQHLWFTLPSLDEKVNGVHCDVIVTFWLLAGRIYVHFKREVKYRKTWFYQRRWFFFSSHPSSLYFTKRIDNDDSEENN